VIALCACFPAMMRIDKLVNTVVLVLPSVGAICLVEHWLFPRIGFVRYWNLYRGRKVNPAALGAWLVSSAFVVVALNFGWMHPFFLFLPAFLIAGVAYVVLAGFCGAGKPIPEAVRRDVDAVEARIAELSEEAAEESKVAQKQSRRFLRTYGFGFLSALMLIALVSCAVFSPQRFKKASVVYTALYFASAAAAVCWKKDSE
jgi:NCS1 family nucleobase:cation symporter-1